MLVSEVGADDLLLVCPGDMPGLWVPPLMLQKFSISENLSPIVPLHDEGPVGAVLTGSLLLDGAKDVPSFVENVLHDTAVPDFVAVGAGAPLLEGNLGLLVPAVDDELVMVHKPLEGVWQK